MRYVLVFFAFWVGLTATPALAATYEETFTPKANKAYNEDINVWVYTSEFAERFAMPEQWIDDDLKGAYAVTFRVETSSARLMFPHKGPNVSMLQRHCVLDVYVDADADIPWLNEQVVDSKKYPPSSPYYLAPQTPEDKEWRWRAVGWPNSGGIVKFGAGEKHLGGFPVREYDKELYPGIMYISFAKSCATPPKVASWIEFYDYRPRNASKNPVFDPDILGRTHRIDIPASFMKRLYDDWYEKSRSVASGEWGDVIKGKGN